MNHLKIKIHFLTFCKVDCNPGAKKMHAIIVLISSITAYIIRVEVELRHDGQAEQHKPHAALPQQQAS